MPDMHIDASFGIGGDMFLAALAGLGLDLAPLADALGEAGIPVGLAAPRVRVNGLAGRRLVIDAGPDQPLRHLPDILGIVDRMPLSRAVRKKTAAAFTRLAQVEAAVHAVALTEIHFHEVGAVDTLIDVSGAFYGLEALGVGRVTCSKLPWFTGRVECAHGMLPLPAPATLELMKGKPVQSTEFAKEIITPTGALILDSTVDAFGVGAQGTVLETSTSFGSHDLGPGGAGLRLILLQADA